MRPLFKPDDTLLPNPFDLDQFDLLPRPIEVAGSTVGIGAVVPTQVKTAGGTNSTAAISVATHSVLAGTSQAISLGSLFSVGSSSANPTYLIVSGLDRDEYTVGYKTSAMGHLAGTGSSSQSFSDISGDAWSVGVVFTYNSATGQYVNATYGSFSQLNFDTGTNHGDTTTLTLFGTSNASLANSYATNPYVMVENPSYFTDYGSVAVVTGASASTPPSTATPNGIVSAAMSYVGSAWNDEGCWVLASDISAKAGATLPLTSTLVGVDGIGNGEWFVAYDGPVSASSNWVNNLVAGEMVSFVTTSGGGHITTVVSGHGASADLVDNITYVNGQGTILDSANDGSSSDIIVQAPHAASQEFTGVNAADVVVYELDTPVVTDTVTAISATERTSVSLAGDFTASNPEAGQSVTQYQVYESTAADALTLSGVTDTAALSAATAATVTSLANLGFSAGTTSGTDTIDVRASNGLYWGDWTALTVTVAAPTQQTVAQAIANTGTGELAIVDTAADIGAGADKLQALAAAGRIASVTISGGGLVPLSAAQLTTDHTLVSLLPSSGALQVSGATVAEAATLQANAQISTFSITDTAADVSGHTTLNADSKLTALTISGTTGADTLNLAGITIPATINLLGNSATASGGLGASTLSFLRPPDAITLGSGAATITAGISGSSGIETITNFQFGLDILQLNLGSYSSVVATNTSYAGQHAISLSGGGLSQGVVLLNQASTVSAASVLSSHLHIANGVATIS